MNVAVAHSMQGDSAPADWPQLTLDEVRAVLEWWGLDAPATLRWHSPRPLSSAAIVDLLDPATAARARAVFIKRHHRTVRTPAQLEEEHGFLRHLRAADAPVSRVLRRPDGGSAGALGDFTYEVHELGHGVDLYRDAVSWSPFSHDAHARAAGAALGALHRAACGYAAPPRIPTPLISNDRIINCADPLAAIDELVARQPALEDYLRNHAWRDAIGAALAPFHGHYRALVPELAPLWTHNDWHASNLLWSESASGIAVSTVLDFGLSDRTSAIYDLATAIERNTIPWLDIQDGRPGAADLARVTGLLEGYLAATSLSAVEREAVVAVLPIVHVGYALSEIDYFHGITRSATNADLAYHAFLLGHTHWFLEVQGRSLLEHVRAQLQLPSRTVSS
jgi:Ser/Thr protein kinase RdoA (MazF antagonist)